MKLLEFMQSHEWQTALIFVICILLACIAFAVFGKESKRISSDVLEFEAVVNADKTQENYNKAKVLKTQILKNGFNSDAEFDLFLETSRTFERKYLII